MKSVTFEPTICKPTKDPKTGEEKPAEFSGTVTMRMPTYSERLGFSKGSRDVENENVDDGELTPAQLAEKKRALYERNIDFRCFLAKAAPNFVTEIALKRLEDGFEFRTWEDLEYDDSMMPVITEITDRLVGKNRAGASSTT